MGMGEASSYSGLAPIFIDHFLGIHHRFILNSLSFASIKEMWTNKEMPQGQGGLARLLCTNCPLPG
jgi:hypothetical protein